MIVYINFTAKYSSTANDSECIGLHIHNKLTGSYGNVNVKHVVISPEIDSGTYIGTSYGLYISSGSWIK